MEDQKLSRIPGAQKACVGCKFSLRCMTFTELPFGPTGVQLYCPTHNRAWCVASDVDALAKPGDVLDLTEQDFGDTDIGCICEFEHCPFLHEMPVDAGGFVSAPSGLGDV